MASSMSLACGRVLVAITTLVLWGHAQAGDEYVNPTFCYRIVQPDAVSHVTSHQDGSGVAMQIGNLCEPYACARISISASYMRDAGKAPRAYQDALKHGWVLKVSDEKRTPGAIWVEHLMFRGDSWLDVYETSNQKDQSRYELTAAFTTAQSITARRVVLDILDSWRWVSACR
jgi:hypothetical protein